jgi:hypothetical protein
MDGRLDITSTRQIDNPDGRFGGLVTFGAGLATYRAGPAGGGQRSLTAAATRLCTKPTHQGGTWSERDPSRSQIVSGVGAVEAFVA